MNTRLDDALRDSASHLLQRMETLPREEAFQKALQMCEESAGPNLLALLLVLKYRPAAFFSLVGDHSVEASADCM